VWGFASLGGLGSSPGNDVFGVNKLYKLLPFKKKKKASLDNAINYSLSKNESMWKASAGI